MNTKFVIRRVGVLSLAKIQGVLYAILGLLGGAFVSLFSLLGAALMNSGGNTTASQFGAIFGVGAIILFPILYGILGFILGLIIGGLYNLLASIVGGLEIEGVQMQSQ